ncbi:MAG TPA: hypothetical protein VIQ31_15185 [Phormidium sp.]|jgi:hypothetical protein
MAIVSPWHSIKEGTKKVFHNNTECTKGDDIEKKYRKQGEGIGRELCEYCSNLEKKAFIKALENPKKLTPLSKITKKSQK